MKRGPLYVILIVGVGLVAAPAVFQMFTRAPKGGEMISDFRPFMTEQRLGAFSGYLDTIDGAHREVTAAGIADEDLTGVEAWVQRWPGINEDMGGMLDDIVANIDNFEAVDALPPFVLFPWFFVLPGLILAVVAFAAVRSPSRRKSLLLAIVGVGLIAAPGIFQMFGRAPMGAEMIDDFRPLMRTERVADMQRHFLTIAGAEAELRTRVLPALPEDADLRATQRFTQDWPEISREMAPMIGAMADNLDNFAAVDALPPFWLFPWFFVLPGAIVAVAAITSFGGRSAPARSASVTEEVRA